MTRAPAEHFPLIFDLELSNRCNLDCVMCPRMPQKLHMGDMERSLLDKVLDEALAVPGRRFRLHGIGEPLLSPHFEHAVERIKGAPLDHVVELITNGHLLNRERVRFILRHEVDQVIVSVAAATAAGYEAVRRSTKFDLVVRNTLRLIDERTRLGAPTKVIVQLVRVPPVDREVDAFVEFWRRFDVEIELWHDLNWGLRVTHTPATLAHPPCPHLDTYTVVCWDGRVGICCVDAGRLHVIGNAATESVRDIYNGAVMQNLRAIHQRGTLYEMPICIDCSFRDGSHVAFAGNVHRTGETPGALLPLPRLPIIPS